MKEAEAQPSFCGRRGLYGPANNLRRIWRWAQREHPYLLQPIDGTGPSTLAYSVRRTKRAVMALLHENETVGHRVAFTLQWDELDHHLLQRYGSQLAEVGTDPLDPIEYLVPHFDGHALPSQLRRARVQRWSTIGCMVLNYDGNRFITSPDMDSDTRTFVYWLCVMCQQSSHRIVFLDCDLSSQQALFLDLKCDAEWDSVIWLADTFQSAMHLSEMLDTSVDVISNFVRKDISPQTFNVVPTHAAGTITEHCALVVSGMHELNISQQIALLHTIATAAIPQSTKLCVFLVGDVFMRSMGNNGLDPWSCCCLATSKTLLVDVCNLGSQMRKTNRALSVWKQEIARHHPSPPVPLHVVDIPQPGWRWMVVPEQSGQRLATWFAHNALDRIEPDAVILASQRGYCTMMVTASGGSGHGLPPLQDRMCPTIGQHIRCVRETLVLKFGSVYRIVSYADTQDVVGLQPRGQQTTIMVSVKDVQSSCEMAWIGLLQHHINVHYGERPVYVLLANRRPTWWPHQNPLLIAQQAGHNVVVVATNTTMRIVTSSLQAALMSRTTTIPTSMWQDLMEFSANKYVGDKLE
jgi:hypothetical protein